MCDTCGSNCLQELGWQIDALKFQLQRLHDAPPYWLSVIHCSHQSLAREMIELLKKIEESARHKPRYG